MNVGFNRATTIPALPPTPPTEEGWLERARRALAAGMSWPRHRGARDVLSPEDCAGPFARLVEALAGLPAARRLRIALDAAFGPTALGGRARALVFAVVARGLGCNACAVEAARLLRAEGMTDDEVARLGIMADLDDTAR